MSDLPVLTSPLLDAVPGVRHAFFTRRGGVSTGLYSSLNLGRGSKDAQASVEENRGRAAAHFGVAPGALLIGYQIHSAITLKADAPWDDDRPQGDAVATATAGLACGALAADCAPILIADAQARVVAAVHAGWKGALGGIVQSAVATMIELGAESQRMTAAVGPCIGPASYEVGPDFLESFMATAPAAERFFSPGETANRRLFDLPGFVLDRLTRAGVARAEWIGRDTYAEPQVFFSNRRAVHRGEADYGRLLSAIMLEP